MQQCVFSLVLHSCNIKEHCIIFDAGVKVNTINNLLFIMLYIFDDDDDDDDDDIST